ncbi:hypothetical protein SLE2022_373560 [Rubroshorea leprosula]
MDRISSTWCSPFLVPKEINPRGFLPLYRTLESDHRGKIDLLSVLDLSYNSDGANIDRSLTRIAPLKVFCPSSRPHLNILEAIGEMKEMHLFIWSLYDPMTLQEMNYELLMIRYCFPFEQMVLSQSFNPSPILCQMEALSALGSTFINSWNMKIVS